MEQILEGTFKIENDKLDFVLITKGVSFDTARKGLIMVKEEIERQLANQENCPHYQYPNGHTLP